ncbi:hypothetical protein HYS54_02710 [Candidatus Micrarchaeota archaeon]|nr:hypothetical protein [Candidatus Micrarchaeota archaeon]
MTNFFGTCEPFEYGDNLANYLNDIASYSTTNPHIRTNQAKLTKAFHDIATPEPAGSKEPAERLNPYRDVPGPTDVEPRLGIRRPQHNGGDEDRGA